MTHPFERQEESNLHVFLEGLAPTKATADHFTDPTIGFQKRSTVVARLFIRLVFIYNENTNETQPGRTFYMLVQAKIRFLARKRVTTISRIVPRLTTGFLLNLTLGILKLFAPRLFHYTRNVEISNFAKSDLNETPTR